MSYTMEWTTRNIPILINPANGWTIYTTYCKVIKFVVVIPRLANWLMLYVDKNACVKLRVRRGNFIKKSSKNNCPTETLRKKKYNEKAIK